ncbi:MAG: TrmO family methyltransferase [Polyangiaceae bacterium]
MKSFTALSSILFVAATLVGCAKNADVASGQTENATELTRSEVAPEENPAIDDTDYATFIASANRFGLELAQEVIDTGVLSATKNGVFSPVSALVALSMSYGAAEGDVATAMRATLHDGFGTEKYHVAQNRMLRELKSYDYEGRDAEGQTMRVEVAPVNSLWAERSAGIKTPFLDLMSRQYDSGIFQTDFRNAADESRLAINAWVDEVTKSKIPELLVKGDVDSSTEFVLVNALYFYANWGELFPKSATQSERFDTLAGASATVDMMHRTGQFAYRATDGYEVVQVPYVHGQLHLTLLLPRAGQFETVRKSVTGDVLAEATSGLVSTEVALGLPKFEITTGQLKLKGALAELGFFDGGSELTGLGEHPVAIAEVIQKAFIGTDEAGTEAAAATAVMTVGGNPPKARHAYAQSSLLVLRTSGERTRALLGAGGQSDEQDLRIGFPFESMVPSTRRFSRRRRHSVASGVPIVWNATHGPSRRRRHSVASGVPIVWNATHGPSRRGRHSVASGCPSFGTRRMVRRVGGATPSHRGCPSFGTRTDVSMVCVDRLSLRSGAVSRRRLVYPVRFEDQTPLPCFPIGRVRSPYIEKMSAPRQGTLSKGVPAQVVLFDDPRLAHALDDIDTWSHLWVLFWFDRDPHFSPKVQPPRSARRRGVFANAVASSPESDWAYGVASFASRGTDALARWTRLTRRHSRARFEALRSLCRSYGGGERGVARGGRCGQLGTWMVGPRFGSAVVSRAA